MSSLEELENKLSEITKEYEDKMQELNAALDNADSEEKRSAAEREINILEYCYNEEAADLNLKIFDEQILNASGAEKEILILQKQLLSNDIQNNQELVILYTELNNSINERAYKKAENKINALQHSFSAKQSGISLQITDKKLESASGTEKEILILQKESLNAQKELDTILSSLYEKAAQTVLEEERKKTESTIALLNSSYQEKQDKINLLIINKELKTASGEDKERLELQKKMLNTKIEHNAETAKLQNELKSLEDAEKIEAVKAEIQKCTRSYNEIMKQLQREMKKYEI